MTKLIARIRKRLAGKGMIDVRVGRFVRDPDSRKWLEMQGGIGFLGLYGDHNITTGPSGGVIVVLPDGSLPFPSPSRLSGDL